MELPLFTEVYVIRMLFNLKKTFVSDTWAEVSLNELKWAQINSNKLEWA